MTVGRPRTSAVICCETEAVEIEGSGHDFGCIGALTRPEETRAERNRANDRRQKRRERMRHYASRVLVDGRLVTPGDHVPHGTVPGYQRFGCRCLPCAEARSAYRKDWADARRSA